MSLIPIDVAMHHVKAEEDDRPDVERKLASAIETAEQFMGRRVFASDEALATSQAQAEIDIKSCVELSSTSFAPNANQVLMNIKAEVNQAKFHQAKMAMLGIVINPAIEIGVLLILGDLYKNRENTVDGGIAELPMGAKHHLQPFRVDMGV